MSIPTEDELTELTRQHWMKWLPGLAQSAQRNGTFDSLTQQAAQETLADVQRKVSQGMHPMEAYEMLKQDRCFLNPRDWNQPQPQ